MVDFYCTKCGTCCTKYWIPLSHLDLFRLKFYGSIDIYSAIVLRNIFVCGSSKHYPAIVFDGHMYYLSLKSLHGRCIFLSDNGECLVHGFKPLACRFYPFKYTVMNNDISIEVEKTAVRKCPGLILDDKPIAGDIWRQLLMLARLRIIELNLYDKTVDEWNKYFSNKYNSLITLIDFLFERARRDFKTLSKNGLWIK